MPRVGRILAGRPPGLSGRAGTSGRPGEAPSGSAFTPSSVASLLAWYDFSDASLLFQLSNGTTAVSANNDPVGYVTDKTSGAKHFIQATAGSRPLFKTNVQNGRSVVKFDGTDDFLTNALAVTTSAAYVMGVFSLPSTNKVFMDGVDGVNRLVISFFIATSNEFGILSGASGFDEPYTAAATYHLWEAKFAGASSAVLMDSAAFASGTTATITTAGLTLCVSNDLATGFGPSGIGELLFFSAVPSAGDLASLRTYLNARWATF